MKYNITLSKTIEVEAENEQEAEKKMINICASDSECLMPHNMEIEILEEGQI
jgi:hypothetical protein